MFFFLSNATIYMTMKYIHVKTDRLYFDWNLSGIKTGFTPSLSSTLNKKFRRKVLCQIAVYMFLNIYLIQHCLYVCSGHTFLI
ncbi:hypothetical protein NP493_153g02002 [Ridgeia piscesae]|uniref:Uncharacterized protein n=1 Tax=Ridgeia piscesae TaxID=27915 RepID=A0AAD9P453_RIDPI|nr:hypothetical protein NP493_153g02002 [Ridgeia piscesae]